MMGATILMVVCSKHWVFTLNNYTDDDQTRLRTLGQSTDAQYLVYGRETGDGGTPHLQGYIIFTKRISFNTVKNTIGERAHIEKKCGTTEQAADYCKKDGDFEEFGSRATKQGRRTDLDELYYAIKNGEAKQEIGDTFAGTYIRYKRSIDQLIAETKDSPRDRERGPNVIVHWGTTGTGKTRAVWDTHDEESIYAHGGDRWFDGYDGHQVALFDDFNGSEFKLSYFLKLLDRYPMRVPIKGGFVQWKPEFIYITSNKSPEEWYANAHPEHQRALQRRFTEVKQFTNL